MRSTPALVLIVSLAILGAARPALAQNTAAPQAPPPPAATSEGKVGVAVKMSTLGVSFEAAARVHRKANIRAGFNVFSYSRDFDDSENNITYVGKLELQSIDAYLDWFPFGGGFHISPGLMIRNNNKVGLSAAIPNGQKIEIDDVEYFSSSTNPIKASGQVTFETTRPALLIGWGNIIPQSRRFSVPFELGVIFQGAPTGVMSFTGTACAANGLNCRDMGTDAAIQSDIKANQEELNTKLAKPFLRYYPVLSLGFAFRF